MKLPEHYTRFDDLFSEKGYVLSVWINAYDTHRIEMYTGYTIFSYSCKKVSLC